MEKNFRRPEIYNRILCAIANGNHRISDIGRFTDFAYNKCDNYISALLSTGIVKTEKEKTKTRLEKTVYSLSNSYFKLWYLYVYQNRTELTVGNEALRRSIAKSISEKEIHEFHIQKAFYYVNNKMLDLWASFRISDKIIYAPQTVQRGSFSYSFDAIHRNGDKAVFVKVFSDPLENCKRDELEKLRKAVILINKYYDSHVFIFTKRRVSDYAAQQAPTDETISFVEIERLR
jgi:predicted transcriptional regulator